jgi:hypothetical protein
MCAWTGTWVSTSPRYPIHPWGLTSRFTGKHLVHGPGGRCAPQRNLAQSAVQPVEDGNRPTKEAVQGLGRHPVSNLAVLIAEAVPLVVAATQPNRSCSTRFQILREHLERSFGVRRMVKQANTVDAIEGLWREGRAKTSDWKATATKSRLHSGQCRRRGPPADRHFGEPARAAQPTSRTGFPRRSSGLAST